MKKKVKEDPETNERVFQFEEALKFANLKVVGYHPGKPRALSTNGPKMSLEKFCFTLRERLGGDAVNFPQVFRALHDMSEAEKLIEEYSAARGFLKKGSRQEIEMPSDMVGLVLNFNMAAQGKDSKFFLTDENEIVSPISGEAYLLTNQLSQGEAVAHARSVIPEYMPRETPGVSTRKRGSRSQTIFNSYRPPAWFKYPGWDKLPEKPPALFMKLIRHLIPDVTEQTYFFDWLHDSLFSRSFVYLVLCAAPGTGKNRLKQILRALHGHENTIDGKKSTLTERFNSQLSESTLAWFDELQYDQEMENVMKEMQNDSISIERKGVDATRGTRLYASIVISNNKPRDNYIAFDARKFAALMLSPERLEKSMTPDEINTLTKKVENADASTFDIAFVAQIAKWLKKRGRTGKWPNLEYQGPMFWRLAHTSMTQWQKQVVSTLISAGARNSAFGWCDKKEAYLWSTLQGRIVKKSDSRHLRFPDYSTSMAFLKLFKDGRGRTAFKTEMVKGQNVLGDFWVQPIFKETKINSEDKVAN